MPTVSEFDHAKIVTLRELGWSYGKIAAEMNCSKSTAQRTFQRYTETGKTADKPKSGRPKLLSPRENRIVERKSLANRFLTAPAITAEFQEFCGKKVSVTTIRRCLRNSGLFGRVARRKPLLSAHHRRNRLSFAKRHLHWTFHDWEKIIFSDESRFQLFYSNGRTYVRRRKGEEFKEHCIIPTVKHGGGSIMVWGWLSAAEVGRLERISTSMDSELYQITLQHHLLPMLAQSPHIFQQDNARPHTSRSTRRWFTDHEIEVLEWPSQSPDLNPIENLWDIISRRLQCQTWRKPDELWQKILDIWTALPTDILHGLIASMPSRLQAVISARGGHTKY